MNPNTIRIIFGIFLIAHGLMTMSLSTVPVPAPGTLHTPFLPTWWRNDVDPSWPVSKIGLPEIIVRTTGWCLWLVILVLFFFAGLGVLGLPGLSSVWQPIAVIAASLSLILLLFYWHPWLVMGVVLNTGILAGVFFGWFSHWFSIN